MSGIQTFLVVVFLFAACRDAVEKSEDADSIGIVRYQEPYRPQFHFSPQEKWMNDPNGLFYHEGVYHLFYQYYPEDIVWGPMHWGHAISTDMVHWQHRPIALYPDEHGLIFSGSAVVDKNNTSGFGVGDKIPLVAIFTYHSMEGEKAGRKDFQTQGIAYSLDNGNTWTKYGRNPVIENTGIKDFRDPKVFWHEATKTWIMVLVAGDRAKLYRSNDLREWQYLSDFGENQGAHGGVWECPDLFPIKVVGMDEEKWVLIISINPGAPNGGSGTQYFVGDFDGKRFESNQKEPKWLDWGTDNYAGVTYNNAPDDERIFIGWMSNWDYARNTPTKVWRSAMTVPRVLSLTKSNGDYVLKNFPIAAIDKLSRLQVEKDVDIPSKGSETLSFDHFNQAEIMFKTKDKDFRLMFKNGQGEALILTMDSKKEAFFLNRMHSGRTDFQAEFGNKVHHMPINDIGTDEVRVRILLDWSSIEVFFNEGRFVMTDQIFPLEPYRELIITNASNKTIQLNDFKISHMQSVW
ncbi:MAG: glycoside hydrolase family 32 protein [Bacteroidota bacterium]